MSKIEIKRRVDPRPYESVPSILRMLPFFKSSGNSKYYHRVRRIGNHESFGRYSHTHIRYLCGGTGFISNGKGRLFTTVPEGGVLCATCEGRAVGAGLVDNGHINGRKVAYSPRKTKDEI